MPDFQIEYDPEKDERNWKKHKIRFSTAALVFTDPFRIERLDDSDENRGEERCQILGKVGKILFVVYTERADKIRIISARIATKNERLSYYGLNINNNKGWTTTI